MGVPPCHTRPPCASCTHSSLQVGGLGVNLTGANCVLIFDPDVSGAAHWTRGGSGGGACLLPLVRGGRGKLPSCSCFLRVGCLNLFFWMFSLVCWTCSGTQSRTFKRGRGAAACKTCRPGTTLSIAVSYLSLCLHMLVLYCTVLYCTAAARWIFLQGVAPGPAKGGHHLPTHH